MSRGTVVGAVLAVLLLYGAFEALPLLLGPSISLESPGDFANIPGGILEVSGRVTRTTALTLNGAPLLPDEQGSFSTTLTFPRGTSILTFTAADRFGRTVTLTKTIYVPE